MNTDLSLVRRTLESRLNEATSSRELSDSLRIQRVADPSDMTQEAAERDLAAQILDRESAIVRQLRSAIDRIDDGTYGICLECEEEIAPKRLKVMPWAQLCISCQESVDGLANRKEGFSRFEEGAEAA